MIFETCSIDCYYDYFINVILKLINQKNLSNHIAV